jgi:hypothetical protein
METVGKRDKRGLPMINWKDASGFPRFTHSFSHKEALIAFLGPLRCLLGEFQGKAGNTITTRPATSQVSLPQSALLEAQGISQVAFNSFHIWQGHYSKLPGYHALLYRPDNACH